MKLSRLIRGRGRAAALISVAVVLTAAVVAAVVPAAASVSGQRHPAHVLGTSLAGAKGLIIDVNGPLSDPFFGSMKMGADNAAKQLGLDYQYSAAPDETNLGPDYATLLQEAISRHPVAMVVGDFVPTAEDPWIKKATAQGIPVVVVNSGETSWQADGALGFVGEDPYQAGEGAGKAAVEDGIKDLICVDSVPGNPALESRCQGAASAMKAVGGTVTVEDIPSADSTNPAAATEDIQGFVRSHPQADGVLTLGSAYATLALLALKNLGDTAKVKVGTFDVSTANLEAVKSGTLGFLVDQQPFIQGYYSLMMAAQYVAYKVAPTGPIDTGGFIINKTNVDAVLAVQNEYHGLRGAE